MKDFLNCSVLQYREKSQILGGEKFRIQEFFYLEDILALKYIRPP